MLKKLLAIAIFISALGFNFNSNAIDSNSTDDPLSTGISGLEMAEEDIGKVVINMFQIDREDNQILAGIEGLSSKAQDLGLGALQLKGEIVVKEKQNDRKQIFISWDSAKLGNKEVDFSEPFVSEFWIPLEHELSTDDEFRSLGDPAELIAAMTKLENLEDVIEEEEKEKDGDKEDEDNRQDSQGGAGAKASQESAITSDASSTGYTEPTIKTTTDGCEILIDYEQEVAIVQEQTLVDGTSEGCEITLTRYPLTKEYVSCGVIVDIAARKTFEQYTLGYLNPDTSARVVVVPCKKDDDKFVAIVETEEGCTPVETSTGTQPQSRLIYVLNGTEVEVRACQDLGSTQSYTDTSIGCDVRLDFNAMTAYQQTRKIYFTDGEEKEYSGCADSSTTFAMTEKADGCSISESIQDTTATQNKRILYTNASGIEIQARGCQASNTTYTMTRDASACSVRHDFASNTSYQQSKLVYTVPATQTAAAVTVIAQGCTDDPNTTFTQVTTTDTCTPIQDAVAGTITFLERIYVEYASGVRTYITSCTPDLDGAIPVQIEACTGASRFTHDFNTNQSYLNQSTYYIKNTAQIYITTCAATVTTYPHLEDESVAECAGFVADDANLRGQYEGKVYITVDAVNIYITPCQLVGTPVPYIPLSTQWTVSTSESNITITGSNTNAGSSSYNSQYATPPSWSPTAPLNTGTHCDTIGTCYSWTPSGSGTWNSAIHSWTSQQGDYCLENSVNTPWVTSDGRAIDNVNSDQSPTFSSTIQQSIQNGAGNISYRANFAITASNTYGRTTYTCGTPICSTLSTLEQNPAYNRGDGSTYIDTATTISTKTVCGYGSSLTN